jgi:tetratricopeptide (TPR) repeat protein
MAKLCGKCGAPADPDKPFCEECGASLTVENTPPPDKATPPPVQSEQQSGPPAQQAPGKTPAVPVTIIIIAVIGVLVLIIAAAIFLPGMQTGQQQGVGIEKGTRATIPPSITAAPAAVVRAQGTAAAQAAELVDKGRDLRLSGDLQGASDTLDKAIALDPGNAEAWIQKGILEQYDLDNDEAALTAYDKALALAPGKNNYLREKKADLYNQLKQYDKALAQCDEILGHFYPDYFGDAALGETWNQKGRALYGLGRYEEAVSSYDKAIGLIKDHQFAWNGKGLALEKLGKKDLAVAAYQKALEIYPDYNEAKTNLERIQSS